MGALVKSGGAYADVLAVKVKSAGAYQPVAGVFAKSGGAYGSSVLSAPEGAEFGDVLAGVSGTTITITWTSATPGSTGIEFGATTNYGQAAINTNDNNATAHTVVLDASDGLLPATTYHYRVASYFGGAWHYSTDKTFTTGA